MNEIIVILVLAVITVYTMYDRRKFEEKMFKQLDDAIKGIKARDLNEYMQAKSAEDIKKVPFKSDPDEVELSDASDEEFDKFIKH